MIDKILHIGKMTAGGNCGACKRIRPTGETIINMTGSKYNQNNHCYIYLTNAPKSFLSF